MKLHFGVALRGFMASFSAGLFPSVANAEEDRPLPPRAGNAPARAKLRLTPPLAQVLAINNGIPLGGITLGGASIAIELRRLWTLEAGGAAFLSVGADKVGMDLFARVGIAPVLSDRRDPDGRGWTTQLDVLAGYRFIERNASSDGHHGSERTHGIRGNLGLDFTRQFSNLALAVRVLSGVTLPMIQTRTDAWAAHFYIDPASDLRWAIDLGMDLGIAL